MRIAARIFFIVALTFGVCACKAINIAPEASLDNKELIVNSRVSLPLPPSYDKIWLNQSSIIASRSNFSAVYRWIDKSEIEFIGSQKSPYEFFKGAFNNPSSEEEKRFLEGFKGSVRRSYSPVHNLEFYFLDNGNGEQIYIGSASLDFVVEVTTKGYDKEYLDKIVQQAYIK